MEAARMRCPGCDGVVLRVARTRTQVWLDPERGARIIEAIRADGGNARFVAADLSDPADIKRLADEAGEVDSLINNAGDYQFGPTADFDLAVFDAMFDANVRAPFVEARRPIRGDRGGRGLPGLTPRQLRARRDRRRRRRAQRDLA
jgi:NAD(P)-dependent dehydrogenase (short-subunit alcohol dehydrogenase family)